jgi:hypothetical protein
MKQGPLRGLMQEETVSLLALRCSRRRTRASAAAPGAGALPSFLRANALVMPGARIGYSRSHF